VLQENFIETNIFGKGNIEMICLPKGFLPTSLSRVLVFRKKGF
jgi:hypothetical protein